MKKLMLVTVAAMSLAAGNAFAVDCSTAPYGSSQSRYNEFNTMMQKVNSDPTARMKINVADLLGKICRAKYEHSITHRKTLRKLGVADITMDNPSMDPVAIASQVLLHAVDVYAGIK